MHIRFTSYSVIVAGIIVFGIGIPIWRNYYAKLQERKRIEILDERLKSNKNKLIDASKTQVVVFYSPYNNSSLIALKFLDDLSDIGIQIIKRSEGEPTFYKDLYDMKEEYKSSSGASTTFEYYPIIFYNGHAYSGFNNRVARDLLIDLGVNDSYSPKSYIPNVERNPIVETSTQEPVSQ